MVLFVRDACSLGRPDPSEQVISASALSIYQEAEALLADARAQAAAIGEAARQAYDDECKRGYETGRAEARMEMAEQMIENVSRTIDYFSSVEERMIDLVLQAMRRLIADYSDREKVALVARGALAAVRNQKQVTLRVATDRLDMLKESVNQILAEYPGIAYLDLQGDARLQGDACIVETEIGIVESSLEYQLETLRHAFAKILGSRR